MPPAGFDAGGCGAPPGLDNVYLHSGEFHFQVVDLAIPGRGFDFQWVRSYRSRLGPDSPQGRCWDHSYNLWIEAAGNDVLLHDGNGRVDRYRLRPDGSYVANEFFREGHFDSDGNFLLAFADLGTWCFRALDGSAAQGRILDIVDRNGNTMSFRYDAQGRLTTITDTLGRIITVAYRADGRIDRVVDFIGRRVVYDYYQDSEADGSSGDLKSVRSPAVVGTPNGNDFPAGKKTAYTYTEGFAHEDLNHNLLTIVDPKGQVWLSNTYSDEQQPLHVDFDRLVRQERGNPGDRIDVVYVGSPTGTTPWSALPGPTLPGRPPLLAIVNDRVGNVQEFSFDQQDRCAAVREYSGRADPDLPTSRTSNRPLGPVRPSDPAYFETRLTYNADSLVTRIVHPNGNLTRQVHEFELDPNAPWASRGNLRERHQWPGSHTPAGDQTVLREFFEYAAGLGGCCGSRFVTRHVDARGHATEHDYDTRGNRIQTRHRIAGIVEDLVYNSFGQLTEHILPATESGWRASNRKTYYQPVDGFLNGYLKTTIEDAAGFALTTSYVYDEVGNAVQITDPRGNVTQKVFNELNQVVQALPQPVTVAGSAMAQYLQETWYDANDNVIQVDRLNLDAFGQVNSFNARITRSFEYDLLNQMVRQIEEVSPSKNIVTEFQYDANQNQTLLRKGEAVNGNQPGNVVLIRFDERDLLFQETRAPGEPDQSTTQHDYDANGNEVRLIEGLEDSPHTRELTFDGYGRLVLLRDAMGNETLRSYDENGNLINLKIFGELCDVPGSAGNVRLLEMDCTYDAMDRLICRELHHFDPLSQAPIGDGLSTFTMVYSDRSELVQVIDDLGNFTQLFHDTLNRPQMLLDALGNRRIWSYDAHSNVVSLTDVELCDQDGPAESITFSSVFDELDREVQATDGRGNTFQMGYDSRDNLTRVVDARGNTTSIAMDGADRIVSVLRTLTDTGAGGGRPVGFLLRSMTWDDNHRLLHRVDGNGNITSFVYDALDRQIETLFADGTSRRKTYDPHDNVATMTDPNGTQVFCLYDLLDRREGRTIVPGVGVSSDTTFETFKHDGLARLVQALDDDSSVMRSYDSLSNCVDEVQNGKTFTAIFDAMGNRQVLYYPSSKKVVWAFDALNRVAEITNAGRAAAYDYLGPHRVQRRTTGAAGMTSDYQYDEARRLVRIDHLNSTAPIDQRSFAWNGMSSKVFSNDLRNNWTYHYEYDSHDRLTRSQVLDGAGALLREALYELDAAGNRLTVSGDRCPGPYSMDSTAPVPADDPVNQYTSTPCHGIEYDENGNPTLWDSLPRVYDYRDRMVESRDAAGNVTSYSYDALGRRIAKVTGLSELHYYYDDWNVCEERDASDTVVATYVHGPAQNDVVEMIRGGNLYFFFADDLGSIRALTDASGNVVERYEYADFGEPEVLDAAGNPLPASMQVGNPYLFTGQRYDPETGWYECRTRYLDPRSGRFVTRDTIGLWGDESALGNGYTYAANNPQSLVDPLGTWPHFGTVVGAIVPAPWPGPTLVNFAVSGCDNFSLSPLQSAMVKAIQGAGRGHRDARNWFVWETIGYPGGGWAALGAGMVKARFDEWFAGPNGVIGFDSRWRILRTMGDTWKAISEGVWVDCDWFCTAGRMAWVSSSSMDMRLHLCPAWWGFGVKRRGSILLHEVTHKYSNTKDWFYYSTQTDPTLLFKIQIGGVVLDDGPFANTFESGFLSSNADTFEGLYLKHYIP
jgi:RHS repeat-associated protein